MTVSVACVTKRFGAFTALDNVSIDARSGEFLALLGPSGSGKTTLLRIMAGLDHPEEGSVSIDGQDVSARQARERGVGFVFQHYALFRHMTVTQNVAFGLTVKPRRERPPRQEIARRAAELLDLVQLGPLGDRYPWQLSGGQRQRVALARALAVGPRVLLLDEPFGALDAKVRKDLRRWLRKIHEEMGLTSVFVTHDQEEALDLADRVVVVNQGRIEQVGTPTEVYDKPATSFVCDFLGATNRFDSVTIVDGYVKLGSASFKVDGVLPAPGKGVAFVRPHEFHVLPKGSRAGIDVSIHKISHAGPLLLLECESLSGIPIDVTVDREWLEWLVPGRTATLVPRKVRAFAA